MTELNGRQIGGRRIPAANRRMAEWRVTWLIEHSTSHQLLWCTGSFVLKSATFAKPITVSGNSVTPLQIQTDSSKNE